MVTALAAKPVAGEVFAALGWDARMLLCGGTCGAGRAVAAVAASPAPPALRGYVIAPVGDLALGVAEAVRRHDPALLADVHGGVALVATIDGRDVPSMGCAGDVAVIGFDRHHAGDGSDPATGEALGECRRLAMRVLQDPGEQPPRHMVGAAGDRHGDRNG